MASALHEAVVHLLASDEILDGKSTTWGWEKFGKICANPRLSISADPGMSDTWGFMGIDAEGVPAQRRVLMDHGALRGYLADRNGAYHLSKLTGATILPGDARFGITNVNDLFPTKPRITNLDFTYDHPDAPKTIGEITAQFKKMIARQGVNGVYIPDGSSAYVAVGRSDEFDFGETDGQIAIFPNFPYIVTPSGKMIPTKFVAVNTDANSVLDDIVTLSSRREYCPHRCGDGDTMNVERAGIRCGAGIIEDLRFVASRQTMRRQAEYFNNE